MTTGGRQVPGVPDDELLSRLYHRLADEHAARFAASYDLASGLRRYRAWLDARTAGERPEVNAAAAGGSAARRGSAPVRAATARAETAKAGPDTVPAPGHVEAGRGQTVAIDASAADKAVTELYRSRYRSLVGLAALLVRDVGAAEEVVQDAFIQMHRAWPELASIENAESYLRRSVIISCRSVLRHRMVVDRNAPATGGDRPGVLDLSERKALIAALRGLPARQREALVLRYYADMSDAQIAETMGISPGAVRRHTARATSALQHSAERADQPDHHRQPPTWPDPELRPPPGREPA
jgi:RNA polymerase sigma-70 factor (sigma-E family)